MTSTDRRLVTPKANQVRHLVEQRLAAVDDATKETVTVEWRGRSLPLTVVTMPVDRLYYNPESRRISAQRTLDAAQYEGLKANPFGRAAQIYLHELLRGDPKDPKRIDPEFVALKTDIDQHGLRDPGVITRSGILVNGNTRCAALRELHAEDMPLGVLPADANWRDIERVELSLQLRRDYRRDYSYVNLLLAIKEQLKLKGSKDDICQDFRITAKTLDKHMWILAFIEKAIRRSTVGRGRTARRLSLVDFENHQGKLGELYRSYNVVKQSDPHEADILKESRLSALVLSFPKTELRLVEPDFFDRYLDEYLAGFFQLPGDFMVAPKTRDSLAKARALSDTLLRAKTEAAVADPDAIEALAEAHDVFVKAFAQAHRGAKQLGPAERLGDACDELDHCYDAIVEARSADAFDMPEFDEALLNFRYHMERLAKLVGRNPGESGPGITWFLEILNGEAGDDLRDGYPANGSMTFQQISPQSRAQIRAAVKRELRAGHNPEAVLRQQIHHFAAKYGVRSATIFDILRVTILEVLVDGHGISQ